MRRLEKEINDPVIIEEILHKSELCRIGLSDNYETYIVPLNYGYHDGTIYFHSALAGRKMDLIRKNNRVSFEITLTHEIIKGSNSCNWTSRYRSLMGTGTITVENEPASKKYGLDLIMRKHGAEGELEYTDSSLEKMVILKLCIESLSAKQSGSWENSHTS